MQILTNQTNNLGIEQQSFKAFNYQDVKKEYKNWKDEIVCRLYEGMKKECEGTNYKPQSKRVLAIRLNKHPYLKQSRSDCLDVLKKCEEKGFWYFNWITKGL